MCGITGIVNPHDKINATTLDAMTDSLIHRGPDGRGVTITEINQNGEIGLGHRRLSILDLSDAGKQPMVRENLHITFNGEIYNFREIRKELISLGHHFKSDGDTEVILASVKQWGIRNSVSRFNGMFAFAIFDRHENALHLVRDRAGVKPLYYGIFKGSLLFASEIKAFHANDHFSAAINRKAVQDYFRYGYIPDDACVYKEITKVQPGEIVSFKTSRIESPSKTTYWSIDECFNLPKLNIDEADAEDQLTELLNSACSYRMISDVPVGIFLSGGYDSSLVSGIIQKQANQRIETFTIGFKERVFDESNFAKDISNHLGTEHHHLFCTEADAKKILPSLPETYDEPFADASAIPTILVSQMARQRVTVALSADAGDELFGGYNKYQQILALKKLAESIPRPVRMPQLFRIMKRLPLPRQMGRRTFNQLATYYDGQLNFSQLMLNANQVFQPWDLEKLLVDEIQKPVIFTDAVDKNINGAVNSMLSADYATYLPGDILTKVDRATMSISLEGREPLLDYRLAEFAARLPENLKINNNGRKYLLKKVAHRYVPRELLNRPKKGFSVPYFQWLRGDMRWLIDEYLSPEKLDRDQLFSKQFVNQYLTRFFAGDPKTNVGVWTLLMFQMWVNHWQHNRN